MKCPYIIKIVAQQNQNHDEYDENGYNIFHRHELVESKMMMDCLKAECAAWKNDQCFYKGE